MSRISINAKSTRPAAAARAIAAISPALAFGAEARAAPAAPTAAFVPLDWVFGLTGAFLIGVMLTVGLWGMRRTPRDDPRFAAWNEFLNGILAAVTVMLIALTSAYFYVRHDFSARQTMLVLLFASCGVLALVATLARLKLGETLQVESHWGGIGGGFGGGLGGWRITPVTALCGLTALLLGGAVAASVWRDQPAPAAVANSATSGSPTGRGVAPVAATSPPPTGAPNSVR